MQNFLKDYESDLLMMPLFKGVKKQELLPMLECMGAYMKEYDKGEIILLREEPVRCVGVILQGKVQMVKEDLWGNHSVLVEMGRTELFGESFACGNTLSSTVSFEVSKKAKILFLPFEKVARTCTMTCVFHHHLIENMVTLIADKNVQLMEKLEIIIKKTLREKISAYLSFQAQRNQSKYFQIPLGRTELAAYLCADRSALTRELNSMKDDGLIDFEKDTFRILEKNNCSAGLCTPCTDTKKQ